jgi:hypothetical protein
MREVRQSIASNVGACRILGALGEETSANSWTVPLTLAPVISLFLWAGADRGPKAPFCMRLFYDPPKRRTRAPTADCDDIDPGARHRRTPPRCDSALIYGFAELDSQTTTILCPMVRGR